MSDIRDKIQNLLRQNQGLMAGADWKVRLEELARQREAGEYEIDKVVPGELIGEDDNRFYHTQQDFPLDFPHGDTSVGAALEAIPEHIAFAACDPDLDAFDPSTAVFVDTETTGLSGGTGTMAFLVGVGYFTGDCFRLEQCFMRDFDDEEPMLRYLDGLFARAETVVTYNGKSFDLPLLRTRFISNRIPFRLDSAVHFDLLHASRRFWKMRLRDCSLGNVERTILGVQRHGDVNSAEIPQMWFDYLRTRDARKLDRVFYHHKFDILSLAALTGWLSHCLDAPEGGGFEHAEDRLSLVKVHFRQKRFAEVVTTVYTLLENEANESLRHECLELAGYACKRLQDWEGVKRAWELLLHEFPRSLQARLELAKLYEHRTRNLMEAERLCAETVDYLETQAALDRGPAPDTTLLEAFQQRLERIRKKKGRYGGDELSVS